MKRRLILVFCRSDETPRWSDFFFSCFHDYPVRNCKNQVFLSFSFNYYIVVSEAFSYIGTTKRRKEKDSGDRELEATERVNETGKKNGDGL